MPHHMLTSSLILSTVSTVSIASIMQMSQLEFKVLKSFAKGPITGKYGIARI